MAKVIRPKYPAQFSIGLIFLIFGLSFILSAQLFSLSLRELLNGSRVYFGMFLVSIAVVVMALIVWEEILFPVRIKPLPNGGMNFRNHRNKLKTQLLFYFLIPALLLFVFFEYDVKVVRFWVWAGICIFFPVAAKLFSGINNYNDFLKLTDDAIEYRNNKETGIFKLKEIQSITLIRDERTVLHKMELVMINGSQVLIDLDEMELEAFLDSIDEYITSHYHALVKS